MKQSRRKFIRTASGLMVPAGMLGLSGIIRAGSAPSLQVAGTARVGSLTQAGGGGGGGGCSTTSGDLLNECFEGTGYENTWTEVSGTPDEDSALPASFSRLGSQCCKFSMSAGSLSYSRWNNGSAITTTRYFRFYFYLGSNPLQDATNDVLYLMRANETTDLGNTDDRCFEVWLMANFGTGLDVKVRGDAVGTLTNQGVTSGSWYRLEIKWVPAAGAGSEFKLFNSSDTQLGATTSFTSGSIADFQYLTIGHHAQLGDRTMDWYMDGVGVNSTGYLGT